MASITGKKRRNQQTTLPYRDELECLPESRSTPDTVIASALLGYLDHIANELQQRQEESTNAVRDYYELKRDLSADEPAARSIDMEITRYSFSSQLSQQMLDHIRAAQRQLRNELNENTLQQAFHRARDAEKLVSAKSRADREENGKRRKKAIVKKIELSKKQQETKHNREQRDSKRPATKKRKPAKKERSREEVRGYEMALLL
jgi:hypothetical protein